MPARTLYRIRLLFTCKNGDFGAILTERSCTATILKVDFNISDRFLPALCHSVVSCLDRKSRRENWNPLRRKEIFRIEDWIELRHDHVQ